MTRILIAIAAIAGALGLSAIAYLWVQNQDAQQDLDAALYSHMGTLTVGTADIRDALGPAIDQDSPRDLVLLALSMSHKDLVELDTNFHTLDFLETDHHDAWSAIRNGAAGGREIVNDTFDTLRDAQQMSEDDRAHLQLIDNFAQATFKAFAAASLSQTSSGLKIDWDESLIAEAVNAAGAVQQAVD